MAESSVSFVAVDRPGMRRSTVNFDVGSNYDPMHTIGTGAYGVVCSAISKTSGKKVAIKKISNAFEILMTAKRTLRELKLLLHFKHDNIVGVKNILHRQSEDSKIHDVYVVMDLMESDLHHVIRSPQPLTENHICYFIYQLLRGLKYIHSANVIHRDLKPSNLLVNENCELKIGDFGMARGVANSVQDHRNFMTEYVATRWYRAPELMLSMSEYSMAIDMWSVGCIFAEMIARKQLFPGRNYIHQLQLIISVLGSPSAQLVGSIRSERVRSYVQGLPYKKPVTFKALYPKASDMVIDLLSKFLQFDPSSRENAENALQHPFFQEYHDQDDEPYCPRPFDFRFETAGPKGTGPTKESVKQQVIRLINDYHSKRNRIKKQLIFLPKNSTAASESTPDERTLKTSIHDANNNGSEVAKQDVFKKPSLIPLVKSCTKASKSKAVEETAVEQMSAKSETAELGSNENITSASNDVAMLSAKSAVESIKKLKNDEQNKSTADTDGKSTTKNQVKTSGPNVKKTISETTKMLVRDTILASMLAKKNGLTKTVEKSKKTVTAAERQREREEKRRKRQEKAAEKERKKREAEGNKSTLSEEDKNLLERWSKMQQQAKSKPELRKADEAASKENVPIKTMLSPNTLTRQSSLPSLAVIRPRVMSNPEPVMPSRRWSLNSYDNDDNKVLQYAPMLSDIPPSPMIPCEDSLNVNPQQAQPTLIITGCSNDDNGISNPLCDKSDVENQSSRMAAQHFQAVTLTDMNSLNNSASFSVGQEAIMVSNVGTSQNQSTQRPNSLDVTDRHGAAASLEIQTPSSSLLPSAKSLVNLSPDTVDYVLNQQLQNSAEQPPDLVGQEVATASSPEKVLTLSPGKTSLVVKQYHTNDIGIGQKSASLEFSPQSFMGAFHKGSKHEDQFNISSQGASDPSKFMNANNGSVMLSESAISHRNEMLYVNSDLTHNPLRQPGHPPLQSQPKASVELVVGGYGVGHELDPDASDDGLYDFTSTSVWLNDIPQQSEMECDSAKSSSSLLNDWLEASQMEQRDMEQLQRELELGSPMCVDDYSFKPD